MRTRSQSGNNFPQQEASPAVVEPLRIELPFLEDQFQEDPPKDPPEGPMADNRTMEELLQAPTEGYDDAIFIPEIAVNNVKLKHGLINLIQNKQFFRHDKEDPHAHIRYFNKITSTMRVPNVPSSSIKLMLFPFSLEGAAQIWLEKEPPRSILTWDDLVTKFINQFVPPSKTTNLRNEITRFQQRFDESFYEAWDRFNDLLDTFYNALNVNDQDSLNSAAVVANVSTSSSTPSIPSEVAELKDMVRALLLDKKNQSSALAQSLTPAPIKAVEPNCVTCDGSETLPSNSITNPKEDLKGITTRSGVAYQGPTNPTPSKVVKQGTEVTKDQVQTLSSQSTAPIQPSVIQSETQTLVSDPVVAPVSAPIPNLKPSIPYPTRRDNERRRDQANVQIEKFYEIFKDMSFEISFTDALILMPKFASTLKALIGNKEKLSEMARTPMNEHCSAVILNKLPRKLGDPGKFLILCEFLGMDECLALADLVPSINLMPLFVWEGLLLPELTPTCMTLELANRSVSKPIGIAKDVSVKVGVFYFPADFVVVDFEPNPRVPLLLKRCFLKTGRALIDVYKGELTLRIRNEAITYNLDQTSRYSANYNEMTANKIDVIDLACEEYSQEVLGFSDVTASGNPTPYDDPIVSTTSLTLTPFGDSDFLLFEEADAFLGLEDDLNSPEFNPFYYDPKGDILLLETILNSEPLPPLPNHEQYLPSFKKEVKVCEAKTVKSSVDEPPEVELKDLPHHLEYAFLEGKNKFLIIISKELGDEEKSALIKVLMSHKRAIAWKLSDIQEVEKLFDAGLIYPISDSPWVSPVHCVPKKGGFIVVENEENELIPTRLVTGWREKTTFTCPYGTFAYRRMPFGLCNAPGTFQRCMLAIFHDMVEKTMEVFMDDFSVFRNSFENCRSHLDKMLQRCEDTNLCLNWEKSHFMVKEGIVLGHKISKNGIKVDRAKVDVISKLPHPTTVKVRQSRAKAVVAKVNSNSSTPAISSDVAELKDMVRALLLDKKNQSLAQATSCTPALIKAVESNCVTCGGTHSYQNCPATSGNVYQDNINEYVSQAAATNYNQGNTSFRPQMVANQIRPPGFPPFQNNQNNFNRRNNFTQNRGDNFNQSTFNQSQLHRPQGQGYSIVIPLLTLKKIKRVSLPEAVLPIKDPQFLLRPNKEPRLPRTKCKLQAHKVPHPSNLRLSDLRFKLLFLSPLLLHFTDALILMPKFAFTLKALIGNKEELSEIARTSMNEHCLAVILNKLPRKLGDSGKFLIPCEFPGMDECLALADFDITASGNPTPYDDPIVSTTSPTLTPFGDSDFLLFEEADAFLGLEDDPNSPKINPFYYDLEGDILLLEAILNSEPLPPLPNHEQYLPSFKKELKVCEAKTVKSSVDEPPEVELKD
nr:reverse transcriptase domain-containing protein [Tanacetum cinerariifolium]